MKSLKQTLLKLTQTATAVLVISILFYGPALAVEATGEGTTHRQALNNALKNAVEMSLGTQVETQSLVENFMVVQEKILTNTKGYVKSYKILTDEKDQSGIHRITIKADVDEARLLDSREALSTLMKMAAHPKVFVVGLDDDFDALSSHTLEFALLQRAVTKIVRDEFEMDVVDLDGFRSGQKNSYRYTDRKNNMRQAKQAKAQFALFVEVLKNKGGTAKPFTLSLETVDVAQGLRLAHEKFDFSMDDWTSDAKENEELVISEAGKLIHAPTAKVAAKMIESLQAETYGEGKRYELSFSRFDEKTIQFLEEDLKQISGYVRHKLMHQKKNALTLSYWSELEAGALNARISSLLKGQEITFTHSLNNRTLNYRYKDPFFE